MKRTASQQATPGLRGRCSTTANKVPVECHVQLPVVPIPGTMPCGVLEKTIAEHARVSHFSIPHVQKGVMVIVAAFAAHPIVFTRRAIQSLKVTADHALPLHRQLEVTTRETVTTATEIQQKTIEGFCCFGRVVGVIL